MIRTFRKTDTHTDDHTNIQHNHNVMPQTFSPAIDNNGEHLKLYSTVHSGFANCGLKLKSARHIDLADKKSAIKLEHFKK